MKYLFPLDVSGVIGPHNSCAKIPKVHQLSTQMPVEMNFLFALLLNKTDTPDLGVSPEVTPLPFLSLPAS
jgi:hypothetical protein